MKKIDKILGFALMLLALQAHGKTSRELISMSVRDASVASALRQVNTTVGENIVTYKNQEVAKESKRVTADMEEVTVLMAVNTIIDGTNLRAVDRTNDVLVVPATATATAQTAAQQPPRNTAVGGTVRDSDGNPLTAAAVMVVGTSFGVPTDAQGRYEILAPAGATLRFSHIGMVSQDVPVNGRTRIDITLQGQTVSTDRVIVTGYQTISSDRATGSFGSISEADLAERLSPNFQSILEGQVAGLSMGANNKVEIRGVSTFQAGAKPLIVVDGFPIEESQFNTIAGIYGQVQPTLTEDGTLDNINYDNVASITVLKDGVAASIYGSRAANGVIVITTKRGGEGKPQVTYKGVFGLTGKNRVGDLNYSSTNDYIDAQLEMFDLTPSRYRLTALSPINEINYLKAQQLGGQITEDELATRINALRGNDFAKEVEKHLFRNELSHHHTVGVSGGGQTVGYNASVQYVDTRGNFVHTNNDRLVIDLKNNFTLSKWLTADLSANVNYTKAAMPRMATSDDAIINNLLDFVPSSLGLSTFQPYSRLYNADGSQGSIFYTSPALLAEYGKYAGMKEMNYSLADDIDRETVRRSNIQSRVNAMLRAQIIDGLSAEAGVSWQRGAYVSKVESQAESFRLRDAYNSATSKSHPMNHYFPDGDMIDEMRTFNENWTVRGQLNFSRGFNADKHRVSAILGNEIRRTTRDINTMQTRVGYNPQSGSSTPMNIMDYNGGVYDADMLYYRMFALTEGRYNFQDNRFVSWYGNGSYEFDNRFIVSGSIRWDNTNFFGTDPKYRYRPLWSVGGTWKIANEKFFDVKWIDMLNLRASYGVNGNIALNEGPFLVLSTGTWDQRTAGVPYSIASAPNHSLRWERTKTTNVGADIAMLGNRLSLTLDLYNRMSDDLLAPDNADGTTGYMNITRNVGKIRNRGVEVTLGGTPVAGGAFRWRADLTFSYNRNKVLRYDVTRTTTADLTNLGRTQDVTGYPATGMWVYRFAGLNDQGEMTVYNKAGEVISPANAKLEDLVYGGTTRPTTELALTNRFNYKNWDFSFMVIGRFGHKFVSDYFNGSPNTINNRHVADRWREPGDEAHTIYPKLTDANSGTFYYPYADVHLENAGYAKLRDVTLGYTFGKNVTNKLGIGGIKVYIQARNLLTLTAKGVDIDPETVDMTASGTTAFRIPREFYAGVQISF